MEKIEHVGIAVDDLDEAIERYSKLLGRGPYKREEVESEGVITVFFKIGDSKIELLKSTKEDGPIAKFIKKKGEGIHHIAFGVENIVKTRERLEENKFNLLNALPKDGADNKLISFIHPKSANGVLVEICQEKEA